jgi:hypothetical protein
MNVDANAASENWESFFQKLAEEPEIDEEGNWHFPAFMEVELSDSQADLYDFDNAVLVRRMRERLVEALQVLAPVVPQGLDLKFGNRFFMTMNQQQQQSFFGSIFNLPVSNIKVGEATDHSTESPAITICTPALLETLPQLHRAVDSFEVSNFALTRPSDVQALSNIISSKRETFLRYLALESMECTVDDCNNRRDSDESDGFLDPLFHVASGLNFFGVSTKTHSARWSLVSPTALRALFVDREGDPFRTLSLRGLGLTDSHVLAIVDALSTRGNHLNYLNLDSNPGISAQGYGALLNLINQANLIGEYIDMFGEWFGFCVDDKVWEGKLNLVSEMNSQYRRLEYLTNGTFTSEESRWKWLEMVVDLPSSAQEHREEWDAKHLNFIWYTLCQNPEMMQVSQAPTRTRE